MTTQVPHRKLRREPWKFGKPQNIFATKRGPLKTLLAVHHKGISTQESFSESKDGHDVPAS